MCGIIGLFNVEGRTVAEQAVGEAMNAAIWHRGPDGGGVYRDEQAMLGMRRLAFIDVEGGQQPMFSEDRQVVLVFNGEIYNYRALRTELQARGHRFHSLVATRDLLAPHGTLLVHLPPDVAHDVKVQCDRLFGRRAYLGEIVWAPGNGPRGNRMPRNHNLIFAYVAQASHRDEAVWNAHDPALREPYAETSRDMHFTQVDADGRRFRERVVNGKAYRYFEEEGRLRGSIWTDLPAMLANTPLRKEGTGYPTQKPLALLERLLRATSKPGDRVLDPMCGSGTTLVAAHALGRSFVCNDKGDLAIATTRERLEGAGIPHTLSTRADASD